MRGLLCGKDIAWEGLIRGGEGMKGEGDDGERHLGYNAGCEHRCGVPFSAHSMGIVRECLDG